MSSPKKKKTKLVDSPRSNKLKRTNDTKEDTPKRLKTDKIPEQDIHAKKRSNFIKACEIVSYKAYCDQRTRFQLIYLPICANTLSCTHSDHKSNVSITLYFNS
jgi:hypothetical protein